MLKLNKMKTFDYILYASIVVIAIGLDQLTKWLAVVFLKPVSTVPIIQNVLHLTYVENRGAAFGMLKDARYIFIIVSAIAILAMAAWLFLGLCRSRLMGVAIAMTLAGGIGNMIDRLALSYVVDFVDFRLIDFAVFNVADSFVCVGAGLLFLWLILDLRAERKKGAQKES